MSPEQTVGKPLDCRTDIFALGTTLWELTVDRRLFKGKDDVETLTAVHNARIPDPTKLVDGYPPQFWAVLRRALERDRNRRFRTAQEFSLKLDECAGMEGRQVTAAAMKEVMQHLFAVEQERQLAWIAEASGLDSLRPIPCSKVEVPPGTFAPATRDDIDSADILEAVCHPDATEPFDLARRKWPRGTSPQLLAGAAAVLTALSLLIAAILWKP
jgi:serine/threonine-protein kinase